MDQPHLGEWEQTRLAEASMHARVWEAGEGKHEGPSMYACMHASIMHAYLHALPRILLIFSSSLLRTAAALLPPQEGLPNIDRVRQQTDWPMWWFAPFFDRTSFGKEAATIVLGALRWERRSSVTFLFRLIAWMVDLGREICHWMLGSGGAGRVSGWVGYARMGEWMGGWEGVGGRKRVSTAGWLSWMVKGRWMSE
jgi:hypothetical protein